MNIIREPIKNWFGFTRRERRSTFIMLLIIVLIIGFRYSIPDSRITIEDISGTVLASENHSEFSGKDSESYRQSFSGNHINSWKPGPTFINETNGIERKRIPYVKIKKSTLQKVSSYSNQQKTLIEINSSDSAMLMELPGIGPVLSARIIKYRRLLGGFARIEQLKEVYGLAPETFEMIKGRVFADSTQITRIDINSASYKEIIRFIYFEKYEVSAILKYRELKGRITGINELIENKLITTEKARKVGAYIKYDE
jgi:DNA uptake protein ComE-like DNA-binding protein